MKGASKNENKLKSDEHKKKLGKLLDTFVNF